MEEETLSRRAFFRGALKRTAKAVSERALPPPPHRIRPPGARPEKEFLALCTGCEDCAKACPHHAIFTLKETSGRDAGTPVMLPFERGCPMCEDYPCITACEPSALQPFAQRLWSFGKVHIDEKQCFTFRGPECGACGRLCPGESKALTFSRNRPQIAEADCVGCGLCIDACITMPKAIIFDEALPNSEEEP